MERKKVVIPKPVKTECRAGNVPAPGEKAEPEELNRIRHWILRIIFRTRAKLHLHLSNPLSVDKRHWSWALARDLARHATMTKIEYIFT